MACAAVGAEEATVELSFGYLSKEMNINIIVDCYYNTIDIKHVRGELEI